MRAEIRLLATVLLALPSAWTEAGEVPHVKVGRFPQEVATRFTVENGLPSNDVRSLHLGASGRVFAETSRGWAVFEKDAWSKCSPLRAEGLSGYIAPQRYAQIATIVNQIAQDADGRLVAATQKGLMRERGGKFEPFWANDGQGRAWGTSDVRGVAFDNKGQLWFATRAGAVCRTSGGWKFYTGAEGLPYNDFTTMAAGPDGVVWFGTHLGVIRFEDGQWHYRQGLRWLPNDDVRGIAVDRQGTAWFATAGGVGRIARKLMTLAEKASFYEDEMERYIRRTPFGYVSEVGLGRPADKSKIIYSDSDNDGLWTSMYGAGECFAYGATKDPKAKDRAKRAFEALRFLQKVTQGGPHSPPKGYVARTIRPVEWPNPNTGRLEDDRREQATGDHLWKAYAPRWPKSADGKWYWKSDTSSDEIDGHYFFYPLYYDLVADTPAEKERVREVVRDLTDHLIDHGYNLVDHDGKPTRWGVYAPASLNNDPDWWPERGLKSLSMLSYLAVALHMTGDAKYDTHIEKLIRDHGYLTNAMTNKLHRGIGSGNQSDDEMAFMSYYNLTKYAPTPKIRAEILASFYNAWAVEQPEMNPFFNFAYAAFGVDAKYPTVLGMYNIGIWKGWLEDSLVTLEGMPLDRIAWACQNSHRLDIVRLPRQATYDVFESRGTPGRGYRVNGKVLPVENRTFNHWNTDPWQLDYGGNGQELASGTVYLLPYYMGRYYGFIQETGR